MPKYRAKNKQCQNLTYLQHDIEACQNVLDWRYNRDRQAGFLSRHCKAKRSASLGKHQKTLNQNDRMPMLLSTNNWPLDNSGP